MSESAPGLKRIKQRDGTVKLYWIARDDIRKAGYTPKTVRLFDADEASIAARCRILQAEMLQWASAREAKAPRSPKGTVAWLCETFELDPDSPINGLRKDTRAFYLRYMRTITGTVGGRVVADLTGVDVRRWHAKWQEKHGARSAYACIQTLRRVVSFGCEIGHKPTIAFAQMIDRARFTAPKARTKQATHALVQAFVDEADKAKLPMMALAVLMQFELALRQKDVIGEWVEAGDDKSGILDGRWRWQWGLTWDHIDRDWILRKPTSKSNGGKIAVHDLRLAPQVLERLQAIPKERRIGPIIAHEAAGRPYRASYYSQSFRRLATAAGWPKDVWNMDSRAGAITEALEAGAGLKDTMSAAAHSQPTTTLRYLREDLQQTSRVAQIRHASRSPERKGNADG